MADVVALVAEAARGLNPGSASDLVGIIAGGGAEQWTRRTYNRHGEPVYTPVFMASLETYEEREERRRARAVRPLSPNAQSPRRGKASRADLSLLADRRRR